MPTAVRLSWDPALATMSLSDLALKAMGSSRELKQDLDHAAFPCTLLGIWSDDRLDALVPRYFRYGAALGAQELRFERMVERAQATRAAPQAEDTTAPKLLVGGCGHWIRTPVCVYLWPRVLRWDGRVAREGGS